VEGVRGERRREAKKKKREESFLRAHLDGRTAQ
jgi:hypothetical protein